MSLDFQLHILKASENGYEEAANDFPFELLELIPHDPFSHFSLPDLYFFSRKIRSACAETVRPALFIARFLPEDQGALCKTTQTSCISTVFRHKSMPSTTL
ncbi:hypothetical protein K443DRAFT_674571 [Laccaria amethystina LaAM-08-1]|uniref:Uncharacterized protein n=1 Tax=Laccaria amethystina LaAM-08-1 TaxID=1095629 RepID=A0A0C9YDL5_9AGAR|nr:hypothetical protein K443DRAFT_674571 [Laccaria amethystina LaAM-08-1]